MSIFNVTRPEVPPSRTKYAGGDYSMPENVFFFQICVWLVTLLVAVWLFKVIFLEAWAEGAIKLWLAVLWFLTSVWFVSLFFNFPYRLATWWGLGHEGAVGLSIALWSLGIAWVFYKLSKPRIGKPK